ncbi:XapX domain-containing protein [Actinoplanes lutulentus]|uniref:XapX domain-containing protein n=1 Tax=Actinoplanes lutulentus TaxID=1287878 RepID=A0A327ZAB7_9ACTN|nr:DUF1427 family protein [Actinoplanes lutulentus]MBB2946361.1 XapX domain-containing protein [Actinoplanes lutulentus]RAK28699.1 XapX domain-containing protein [Actinoplanes lutulentus]
MNPVVIAYAASLGAGAVGGALYWLMDVPSPAPPWVSLCGLLGILGGEAAGGVLLRRWRRKPAPAAHQSAT